MFILMNLWMTGNILMKSHQQKKKNFVETWIKNSDCNYAKRICEDFEIKNLGDYHGLDLNGNILSLADVFDNFWKLCLEIYE